MSVAADRGLPTALPVDYRPVLVRAVGVGFAVMSGFVQRSHLRCWAIQLPDKEFRYLRHSCYFIPDVDVRGRTHGMRSGHFCLTPHVATRIGLYHPLLSPRGLAYSL